jgi:hypothetical protein
MDWQDRRNVIMISAYNDTKTEAERRRGGNKSLSVTSHNK